MIYIVFFFSNQDLKYQNRYWYQLVIYDIKIRDRSYRIGYIGNIGKIGHILYNILRTSKFTIHVIYIGVSQYISHVYIG